MTNACHNRKPFSPTTRVQNGWLNSWARNMVDMEFRMDPKCVYSTSDLGQVDKGCIGCRWRANGQADTGAGVAGGTEQVGAGVVGIRDGQGAEVGESGAVGVQQPTGVAEEQGSGEPSRAAEELEAIHPNAAIYRRAE